VDCDPMGNGMDHWGGGVRVAGLERLGGGFAVCGWLGGRLKLAGIGRRADSRSPQNDGVQFSEAAQAQVAGRRFFRSR